MAIYWEDLSIGDTFTSERNLTINSEDIIEFASKYDPQPYHLDPSASRNFHFWRLMRQRVADIRVDAKNNL